VAVDDESTRTATYAFTRGAGRDDLRAIRGELKAA